MIVRFVSLSLLSTCLLSLFFLAKAHEVPSLTLENYNDMTQNKTVFIKFFAPWCGHSKKLAPEWEKLSKEWEGNKIGLVAQVDCTDGGKALCKAQGVYDFPTIKYGDPSFGRLEEYLGPNSYFDLSEFAKRNLKPICGPHNMDGCDDTNKAKLEELQNLSASVLEEKIKQEKYKLRQAEKDFQRTVKGLEKEYEKIQREKEEKIAKVKDNGLDMLKSVITARKRVLQAEKEAEDIKGEL